MYRLVRPVLGTVLLTTALTGAPALATALPAAAATCPSSGGVSVPEASASGEVVFHGHGWGHGLGMSQYGAEGAAKLGCSYGQILTTYYRGSVVQTEPVPNTIHLRMLDDGGPSTVLAETGAVTWRFSGTTADVVQPKGATYRVERRGTNTTLAVVNVATDAVVRQGKAGESLSLRHSGTVVRLRTFKPSGALFMDRRLRWDRTQFFYDGSTVDAVQVIENSAVGTGMQKYLWGIAEVPTLFPVAALKAQAVAARTYAARVGGGTLSRPLMPTPADQNYTGYAKEAEDAQYGNRWRNAVDATKDRVLKDGDGGYVVTYYSSSMGGHTEDVRYVGWSDVGIPYLTGVDDSRWEMASGNKAANRSWARAFTRATVAARLGFDSISSITVPPRGTSARLEGVEVTGVRNGSRVTTHISGWDVRQALGLLSPNFRVTMTQGNPNQPIVGDWDGDGDDDPGWFRDGEFALRTSPTTTARFVYGTFGDIAVVGDWDGDGDDDIGVFRKGEWFLRNALSAGPTSTRLRYGTSGDRPVVGSWNGQTLGIGVVRGGTWYLRHTASGGATQVRFTYGLAKDRPVAGDWDLDGDATPGMVRGNVWYLRPGLTSGTSQQFRYGTSSDRPVAGDWDGDGRSTVGIVRGTTFYLRDANSAGPATQTVAFGG